MTKIRYLLNYPFGGRSLVQILLRKVPKSSYRVIMDIGAGIPASLMTSEDDPIMIERQHGR